MLAGLLSAARLSPLQPREHRILFYGAGSAGIGVATQLLSFFTLNGMSEEEARSHIWVVDSRGLIYDGRDNVAEYKKGRALCHLGKACPAYSPVAHNYQFSPEKTTLVNP